jgi:N-acetylmuramoyl-L-alanine amidase
MSYKNLVISSGHGLLVRGASGVIDEVDQARLVVESVAAELRKHGAKVVTFHDDTSTTQSENLDTIVKFHNKQERQLDISVHFNAYVETANPMGVEVLFVSQEALASQVSFAMSTAARFINRGAKLRNDLAFLNGTNRPAILIETCFCDSEKDAELYGKYYGPLCAAIAETLCPEGVEPPPAPEALEVSGKVSHFGGPKDMGVSPDEGLAFIQEVEEAPHLFLPYQPKGTTGLARRLNPNVHYIACRWNYNSTPREMLLSEQALVKAPGGVELTAFPADWGPHSDTNRIADLSPGLMSDLKIETDDIVEVIFPI